ncbi:SH2 domain protein, partial [Opisthorchis viverrini]
MTRQVDINKEPWFHGVLPRTEVERLLQNQGDFLVRQTNKRVSGRDPNRPAREGRFDDQQQADDGAADSTLRAGGTTNRIVHRMVLSVYWHGHKHFILCGGDGTGRGWYLENGEFPSI